MAKIGYFRENAKFCVKNTLFLGCFHNSSYLCVEMTQLTIKTHNIMENTSSKTKVYNVIIMDRSGSMWDIQKSAIQGFNEVLGGNKADAKTYAETQEHFMTLVLFDSTAIEIELRDLKTILDDVVIEDYVEFKLSENEDDLINRFNISIDRFSSDRVYEKIREFNSKNLLNDKKKNFKPIEISNEGLEMIEFISLDCENSEGAWTSSSEIKIDKNGYVILNGNKTKEFWDGTIKSERKPLRLKIRNICGDETVWMIGDE